MAGTRVRAGRSGPAEAGPASPAGPILAAFDRLESAAGSEPFRGCPFVDAALGAPGTGDRAGAIAWQHKQEVARALAGLAAQAGLAEPERTRRGRGAHHRRRRRRQAALAPDRASRQRIVRRGRRAAEVLLASAPRP